MKKSFVIYDGQCKFCIKQTERLQRWVGNVFQAESFREEGFFRKYPQFSLEACEKAIQFQRVDEKIFSGAEAVAQILGLRWYGKPAKWVYYIPVIRKLWDVIYANIALNRYYISRWKWFS